jgi:hypothetical protein
MSVIRFTVTDTVVTSLGAISTSVVAGHLNPLTTVSVVFPAGGSTRNSPVVWKILSPAMETRA